MNIARCDSVSLRLGRWNQTKECAGEHSESRNTLFFWFWVQTVQACSVKHRLCFYVKQRSRNFKGNKKLQRMLSLLFLCCCDPWSPWALPLFRLKEYLKEICKLFECRSVFSKGEMEPVCGWLAFHLFLSCWGVNPVDCKTQRLLDSRLNFRCHTVTGRWPHQPLSRWTCVHLVQGVRELLQHSLASLGVCQAVSCLSCVDRSVQRQLHLLLGTSLSLDTEALGCCFVRK